MAGEMSQSEVEEREITPATRETRLEQGSIGRRFLDRYMAEQIEFGGQRMTRAQVFDWFQKEGFPTRASELWMLGHDQAQLSRKAGKR